MSVFFHLGQFSTEPWLSGQITIIPKAEFLEAFRGDSLPKPVPFGGIPNRQCILQGIYLRENSLKGTLFECGLMSMEKTPRNQKSWGTQSIEPGNPRKLNLGVSNHHLKKIGSFNFLQISPSGRFNRCEWKRWSQQRFSQNLVVKDSDLNPIVERIKNHPKQIQVFPHKQH